MTTTTQYAPRVLQDCIVLLTGPSGESGEDASLDAEDDEEDATEKEYEMRL